MSVPFLVQAYANPCVAKSFSISCTSLSNLDIASGAHRLLSFRRTTTLAFLAPALPLQGLAEELGLDLRRLWLRNLGRDDRLVADHGRWVAEWLGGWVGRAAKTCALYGCQATLGAGGISGCTVIVDVL